MPTESKTIAVEELSQIMRDCTIAIATDYSGLNVSEMGSFRTALRENGIKYKVVKNTLFRIAADQSELPEMKNLIDGPTGIAFGYGEEQVPAKVIANFIKDNRIGMKVKLALLGKQILSSDEIDKLASLPSREELVANLLSQLHGQISGLVFTLNSPLTSAVRVLNAPITGLATVLQGRLQQDS